MSCISSGCSPSTAGFLVVGALMLGVVPVCAQSSSLRLKVPITKDMALTDAHEYTWSAEAGQRLHLVVEQQKIDLVVTVFGPDGKQVIEVDANPAGDGMSGPEDVIAPALSAGVYRIRVSPFELIRETRSPLRDGPAVTLTAVSEVTFRVPGSDVELTFVRSAGEVREVISTGNGPAVRGLKLTNSPGKS